MVMRRFIALSTVLLAIGCQPAIPYDRPAPSEPPKTADETPKAVERDLAWMNPRPNEILPDVAIQFVHEKDGPEWARLTKLWNPPTTDKDKPAAQAAVFVKVPAGLDNPRPLIPPSNPPTLHKWELGRRLFYDKKWLTDGGGEACASCHDPHTGFADNVGDHYRFNTPTLVNCIYNSRQFWDGRAGALEEVVQRTLDDEIAATAGTPFGHVWPGVVQRLRARFEYEHQFRSAFGTPPTQDAVGKALATYMRTLLAGDAIHDRALAYQAAEHAPELKAEHYEKALDASALADLKIAEKDKGDAARKIYRGYRLFNDLDERKTSCVACHGGREFTDGKFHNLGVGFKTFAPGDEPGRFASLPVGEKDGRLIGAYKTPTLRGLSRSAPYFHDGSAATLEDAIQFHADGGRQNEYLDPNLRKSDLPRPELESLILFLRALEGKEVDLPAE